MVSKEEQYQGTEADGLWADAIVAWRLMWLEQI